eukprot:4410734-Amphidinium_carterae.1
MHTRPRLLLQQKNAGPWAVVTTFGRENRLTGLDSDKLRSHGARVIVAKSHPGFIFPRRRQDRLSSQSCKGA